MMPMPPLRATATRTPRAIHSASARVVRGSRTRSCTLTCNGHPVREGGRHNAGSLSRLQRAQMFNAHLCSVTVSIGELTSGVLRVIRRVMRDPSETSSVPKSMKPEGGSVRQGACLACHATRARCSREGRWPTGTLSPGSKRRSSQVYAILDAEVNIFDAAYPSAPSTISVTA